MDSAADRPDGTPARPDATGKFRFEVFEVVVERSGGTAGMIRRWSAPVPDDGGPVARAARRIAGLGAERAQGQSDRQAGAEAAPSRVRDNFVWAVICRDGSLQCDEAGRRRDPEVDALISEVTESGTPA